MAGNWFPPPPRYDLPPDEVHVWFARLERPVEALRGLLAADEQARAARFYFEKDRRHYVAARGILRQLIGRYLAVAPQQAAFAYAEKGKPYLADNPDFGFNVAHSHGAALLAFGRRRALGVDLELVRPLEDGERIARRFFSAWEVAQYTAVSPAKRPQAFFNCWTRKEAYIKAIGDGLSCPLDSFDVTLTPGEPARLLRVGGSETAAARWQLESLTPAAGFVGAVMADGAPWRLRCFHWPDES